jgi:hypothetical protein
MIDEHAGELLTNGAVNEGGDYGRVDPAREGAEDLTSLHLSADGSNRLADKVSRRPGAT